MLCVSRIRRRRVKHQVHDRTTENSGLLETVVDQMYHFMRIKWSLTIEDCQ